MRVSQSKETAAKFVSQTNPQEFKYSVLFLKMAAGQNSVPSNVLRNKFLPFKKVKNRKLSN